MVVLEIIYPLQSPVKLRFLCHLKSLPNGLHATITSVGTANLPLNLQVNNAMCVPFLHVNLLPVSQLTSDLNCSTIFYLVYCKT